MMTRVSAAARRGITLTEILIAIFIMAIGMISLATLFPIGLLRLREAQRQTRSAYLFESAAADVNARGLLKTNSFTYADLLNTYNFANYTPWYYSANQGSSYDPLVLDTPAYGTDPYIINGGNLVPVGANSIASGGYGLPFAYDPLWRWQTDHTNGGIYLFDKSNPDYVPNPGVTPEARFADGGLLRALVGSDSDGINQPPSAYGLQRLTNFNRPAYVNAAGITVPAVMPAANLVPNIFVSPEDVVWQDPNNASNTTTEYTLYGVPAGSGGIPIQTPASPVIPDLNTSAGALTNDWRFTWMITAQQTNTANGATFEGNVVVFENRQFALDQVAPGVYQAAGENVYEGVFGPSRNVAVDVVNQYTFGYGAAADRTVLIRWFATQDDPVVKVGDWIADVTYERSQTVINSPNDPNLAGLGRFLGYGVNKNTGVPNPLNNGEWDNLPAQRCFWYQVQKVTPAQTDPAYGPTYRSMTVYVNRKLEARTLLNATGPNMGNPVYRNAVLVCPNVVNVIPQTFFVR